MIEQTLAHKDSTQTAGNSRHWQTFLKNRCTVTAYEKFSSEQTYENVYLRHSTADRHCHILQHTATHCEEQETLANIFEKQSSIVSTYNFFWQRDDLREFLICVLTQETNTATSCNTLQHTVWNRRHLQIFSKVSAVVSA